MQKPITSRINQTGRYFTLVALTTVLAACGGSGGEADNDNAGSVSATDNLDFDMDGEPNATDSDADGDGTIDAFDSFVDLDGDGLDDPTGLTQAEAEGTEEVATSDCDPESGTVAFGQTPNWNGNCTIRRSSSGGEFADSLYSVGVQRIVFCSGFGTADNDDYRLFADGEYGPASEAATQQFQASAPGAVTDDGIVGPNTWAKLLNSMTVLESGGRNETTGEITPDIYGFASGRCSGIALFHQNYTYDDTSDTLFRGGWRLTRNSPNADETLPFSIDQPFGLL